MRAVCLGALESAEPRPAFCVAVVWVVIPPLQLRVNEGTGLECLAGAVSSRG